MDLRIKSAVTRTTPLTIVVDGERIAGYAGESVATALLAAGIRFLRSSPASSPRGMLCAMGVCQECVVAIDGRTVPACLEPVRDGLSISLMRHDR